MSEAERIEAKAEDGSRELAVVAQALPAAARFAAVTWVRGTAWTLETSVRVGRGLARAATDPDAAAALVGELSSSLRGYAREFLGITELDAQVQSLAPPTGTLSRRGRRNGSEPAAPALRAQGAELLRQAADVDADDETHPAYARILTELAPDEARILRLLAVDGPQAAVDVRASNLIGVGTQLVAPGLNMIGAQAGVRRRERTPAYLNNLDRLGLVWFSTGPVSDPIAYQVFEAQPDVLAVIKETVRAKTSHGSIQLTPFGQDFVQTCLPTEPAEIEALTSGSPG